MRFKSIREPRRLQTNLELTLDKAITMARRTEAAREQPADSGKGRDRQHLHKSQDSRAQLLQQKLQTMFQTRKIPKQPTRKVAPDLASFQHIQVPGS